MRPLTKPVLRLLALVLLFTGLGGCSSVEDASTTIEVELATSAGLFEGNDVGVLGVTVGEVTSIDPEGDHVRITLEVDDGVKIPDDAGAVVVSRSMATDRYVELTPVYDGGPVMEDGAVIAPEKTRTPVEWDEVLNAIDTLSEGLNGKAGKAKPLKALLDSSAAALDGNGRTIRRTIQNLVEGTGTLSSHREAFEKTLANLDTLTAAIARNDKLARRFIRNVAASTDLVRDERLNLEKSVSSIRETIRLLGVFIRHHEEDLSDVATNVESISKRVMRHSASLGEGLEVLPVAMENLGRAVNDRQRLDIKLPMLSLLKIGKLPSLEKLCKDLLGKDICNAVGPDLGGMLEEILGGLLGRGRP